MLEKLALKHDAWVKFARAICKDAYLADDLVSEMYLKFYEKQETYNKDINDWYVCFAIKHIWLNYKKFEKRYVSLDTQDKQDSNSSQLDKKLLRNSEILIYEDGVKNINEKEIPDCITWVEKQILLLRQNHSGREIGNKYKIHYTKIYRIEKEAKLKLNEWLKSEKSKVLEM